MSSKKLVSVALTLSTLVWGLGIATLPLANAQTTSDLNAQIAALLAQIQQLQAQLNSAKGGSSSSSSSVSCSFTRDLTVGSKGSDVQCLQQLLNANGAQVAATGAGSPGMESTYFGALTQKAVAAFQAKNGITPAAGYFGPKTRAFIASMSVGTGSTGTGSTGTGSTGTVTPPASGIAVSLSSSNPAAGSLISSASASAARVPVMAINLTASNSGAVTVTDLKVHKTGVLSDSSISGAYLVQNGQVLYQYTSLNQGVIDFSNMNLSVPAGQTVTLTVAIDPSTGLSAGNTVGFSMNAASDVTAVDTNNTAVTPTGMFPLNGNIFTITSVTNPPLATLTLNSSAIGTQVTAGTQNNIVGAWNLQVNNSLVYLKGIKFMVIGSANDADLRNIKLDINGTQVGATLSSVGSNGVAYFDLSSSPASLSTGGNNLQVYADVMGSPNKDFQFEVLNSYDVYALDSQYNVPISVTLGTNVNSSTIYKVQIQQGQITVSQDSSTPTGNIAVGQSGVTLAKFDIYAAGEPVKLKYIGFKLAFTGTTTTISTEVKNIALVDDAGGQVGTTINTPPTSGGDAYGAGASGTACDANSGNTASNAYVDCFGTVTSPINYIIPANTTRVLSLKADIPSNAGFTTVTASLLPESGNLQGLTSSATGNSSGASGSALSLQSSLLTPSTNSAYGNQSFTPNSSNVKIGSYSFSASSASGVQMNTVSIKVAPALTSGQTSDVQNLKMMVNGSQFGTPIGVVADQGTYVFSGSPFTVPAGGTTNVDIYADILSNATTSPFLATQLTGCSGTSVVSYSSVSCSGSIDGQTITVVNSGSNVTVGSDSSAPAASQITMGSTGNTLAAFRFTETSNRENVKVTDLTIKQTTSATSSAFQTLYLYNGSTQVGTVGSAASTTGGYTYAFHFGTPPVIPQNGTLVLTLKGDLASYTSLGSSVDNTASTFGIAATSSVTALGQSSNLVANISGTPTGNSMTILRTTLTPSLSSILPSSGNVKAINQNIAHVTLTSGNSDSAVLNTLKLTFSGSAIGASTTVSDFKLLGSNSVDITSAVASGGFNASTTGSTCSAGSCVMIWTFPTSTSPLVVTAGQNYQFTVQAMTGGSTADFAAASGQNPVSLSMTIAGTGDMTYYDNASATGSTISLPTTLINSLQAVTVSYSS